MYATHCTLYATTWAVGGGKAFKSRICRKGTPVPATVELPTAPGRHRQAKDKKVNDPTARSFQQALGFGGF